MIIQTSKGVIRIPCNHIVTIDINDKEAKFEINVYDNHPDGPFRISSDEVTITRIIPETEAECKITLLLERFIKNNGENDADKEESAINDVIKIRKVISGMQTQIDRLRAELTGKHLGDFIEVMNSIGNLEEKIKSEIKKTIRNLSEKFIEEFKMIKEILRIIIGKIDIDLSIPEYNRIQPIFE